MTHFRYIWEQQELNNEQSTTVYLCWRDPVWFPNWILLHRMERDKKLDTAVGKARY